MSDPRHGPGLYLRTARGLRPAQVLGRPVRPLLRRLLRHAVRPTRYPADGPRMELVLRRLEALRPVVARFPDARAHAGSAADSLAHHRAVADAVSAGAFTFLSETRELGLPDWSARPVSRLWTYHLHYFEFAESLARAFLATGEPRFAARLEELVSDWIDSTEGFRGDGWDPYPTSVRIDRWIRALALVGDRIDVGVRSRWVESLDRQARYLARFVESHLRGNHVIKNQKALVMAGLVLPGRTGERLLRAGRGGLETALHDQVLPDGVHYERSPMYHAIVLEDLLHAIALAEASAASEWPAARRVALAMERACGALRRPDGSWHQFGDAAAGHALVPSALSDLARAVLGVATVDPVGAIALPDAGFYGWVSDGGATRFLTRCGPYGPAEQPGHAHCDLLSFELWIAGRPVVVDTGVRDYEAGDARSYARSTGAHSTAILGEEDQSEIWGAFRVARMARARLLSQDAGTDAYAFAGECTPFHTPAVHRREVAGAGLSWDVRDRVDERWRGALTSALHLHPDLRPRETEDPAALVFSSSGGTLRVEPHGFDRVRCVRGGEGRVRGVWYPAFGVERERTTVVMSLRRNDGRQTGFRITLEPGEGNGGV